MLQSIIVFLAILIIVFGMLQITGSPAAVLMPLDATQEDIQAFSKQMGFDQPLHIQFGRFIFGGPKTQGVIRGDFGFSYRHEVPAMGLVLEHFPNTVILAITAVVIAILISVPAGVLSATFRNSWIDYSSSVGAMFGQSMPNFWLGLLLIMFFAVYLRVLPTSGFEAWYYIILPAFTVGWFGTAGVMRLTRSSMLEVLHTEYVKLARIKGLVEPKVLWKHAFKNASSQWML